MKLFYLLETFVFPTLTEPFLDTIRFLEKKHIFALICKNILIKISIINNLQLNIMFRPLKRNPYFYFWEN